MRKSGISIQRSWTVDLRLLKKDSGYFLLIFSIYGINGQAQREMKMKKGQIVIKEITSFYKELFLFLGKEEENGKLVKGLTLGSYDPKAERVSFYLDEHRIGVVKMSSGEGLRSLNKGERKIVKHEIKNDVKLRDLWKSLGQIKKIKVK